MTTPRLTLFRRMMLWMLAGAAAPKQTTFCYCPHCRNELCANGDLLSDTDLVRFRCSRCGHESGWDFDAPVPLLLEGRR